MAATQLKIALGKETTVRLTCGHCGKEVKMPLIKLSAQLEKCRFCGAEIFDDFQVNAVHELVDAAKDIARNKRGDIEIVLSMKD
jgi:hypothetical protein